MAETFEVQIITGKPILTVKRTQDSIETYTADKVEAHIATLLQELAAIQGRLAYQYKLRDKLNGK